VDSVLPVFEPFWLGWSWHYNARSRAEVAQLAERNLAKVEVAGSNPVFRSNDDPATWPSG
jgi:hypothetical protein